MYKGDNSCGLYPCEHHSKVPCTAVEWIGTYEKHRETK